MLNDEKYFAIIDTETNWSDEIMSIGITIADHEFKEVASRYYIVTPECDKGGMFSSVLRLKSVCVYMEETRSKVLGSIRRFLKKYDVQAIFAYNAVFDMKHLPELSAYRWYDIIKLAAYKQYNLSIPKNADCYGTGRLKRNYGVEPIMRGLSGDRSYREVHNALCDAQDELTIMRLLGHPVCEYECAAINRKK